MEVKKCTINISPLSVCFIFGIVAVILFWNFCPPFINPQPVNAEVNRIDNDYQLKKNNLVNSYVNIVINAKKSNKQINISSLQKDLNAISSDNVNSDTSYGSECDSVLQKIKQRIIKNSIKINNNILNNVKMFNGLKPVVDKNDNKILQQSKEDYIKRVTDDRGLRLLFSILVFIAASLLGGYSFYLIADLI